MDRKYKERLGLASNSVFNIAAVELFDKTKHCFIAASSPGTLIAFSCAKYCCVYDAGCRARLVRARKSNQSAWGRGWLYCSTDSSLYPGASILGARPPQFLDWRGRISNCPPPHFFICSMKFNSKLFSVYCGHCLSLSILLNIIQIQTRSHMLTQSCFFSNFLRCY